jgi:hypothetical protein
VSTSPRLTWSATGATSYDVQFGTTNPPPQVASGQPAASYTPAALAAHTVYFWRIVARNSGGTTTGAVWSFTTAAATTGGSDVVIYASDIPAGQLHGNWTRVSDSTSPDGVKLSSANVNFTSIDAPQASPAHYVDVTFDAEAGPEYALWLRMRAAGNAKSNDAVWVQFSDALADGAGAFPIGSTAGLLVNLATSASASSLRNWGWQNGAYWLNQPRTFAFASTGSHTLRIQTREDGVQVDQIVLSPATYLTSAPGPVSDDSTIVPRENDGGTAPPGVPAAPASPAPANGSTNVSLSPSLTWTASGAASYEVDFGTANPPPVFVASQNSASVEAPVLSPSRTYFWRIVATNSAGSTTGPVWSFTTASASSSAASDIVIYASDIAGSQRHGMWRRGASSSSPGGVMLSTSNKGWESMNSPKGSPANYVDVVYDAEAGTPYTLWLRLSARNDSFLNDSVWIQFSDARVNGNRVFPIGTTSGLLVDLAPDDAADTANGWGWRNGAYWLSQPATFTFGSSGSQTLRIQVREDGVRFDQFVLSPGRYLESAPGQVGGDGTIVPK